MGGHRRLVVGGAGTALSLFAAVACIALLGAGLVGFDFRPDPVGPAPHSGATVADLPAHGAGAPARPARPRSPRVRSRPGGRPDRTVAPVAARRPRRSALPPAGSPDGSRDAPRRSPNHGRSPAQPPRSAPEPPDRPPPGSSLLRETALATGRAIRDAGALVGEVAGGPAPSLGRAVAEMTDRTAMTVESLSDRLP